MVYMVPYHAKAPKCKITPLKTTPIEGFRGSEESRERFLFFINRFPTEC
jgi:hypothetical protein